MTGRTLWAETGVQIAPPMLQTVGMALSAVSYVPVLNTLVQYQEYLRGHNLSLNGPISDGALKSKVTFESIFDKKAWAI